MSRKMLHPYPSRDLSSECEMLRRRAASQSEALHRAAVDAEGLEYSIAHDLRSPLRAVASTASILLEELGPSLEPEHRQLLERQALNAVRFGTLIDDLLAYSRLGRVDIRRKPVDITDIVCGLDPRVEAQPGMKVAADPQLTRIAIGCLVDNALKFSLGGRVCVRQAFGVVAVSDEGWGFDAAYAERIFRPFERLVSDEFPGSGIGLAKVRRIAERHSGRAWAESAYEKGATFFLDLGP